VDADASTCVISETLSLVRFQNANRHLNRAYGVIGVHAPRFAWFQAGNLRSLTCSLPDRSAASTIADNRTTGGRRRLPGGLVVNAQCKTDGEDAPGEVFGGDVAPALSVVQAPPSLVERAARPYSAIMEFLGRLAVTRITRAVPRTLRFLGATAMSGEVSAGVPRPRLSLGLAAGAALDEALLAIALAGKRFPRSADFDRVSGELADAKELFSRQGWINHPDSYHRRPPPLAATDVEMGRGWALGMRYERMFYESEFSTRLGEPGGERWMGYGPNRRASATIVRHSGEPRPWVVCVHGFSMGFPFMDFVGLQTAKLHRGLGLNVALPVLPLHGPRKVTLVSGEPFMSFDMMNTLHGLTQAVWDIRRLISWIRDQGATSIGLYGISLGAYVVSLLAGIEEGLDAVVAGVPAMDFPALLHEYSPQHIRARSIEHRILGVATDDVFRVVSPISFQPKVAHDRRFLFAGYGDRLAFPDQARRLWEHWEKPRISWYSGNHMGFLWSPQVRAFLGESLAASGLGYARTADGG
jgi:hypothetical protein